MYHFWQEILQKRWRSLIVSLIVGLSLILGWGTSYALESKSVDKAMDNFAIGEELYLNDCATCHIPIPPAVLPRETWKTILENPGNHYGVQIKDLVRFNQRIIWQYLQHYSRGLLQDELEPKYISQSRYFFALHPQVEFSAPINTTTCIECHARTQNFDYRIEY